MNLLGCERTATFCFSALTVIVHKEAVHVVLKSRKADATSRWGFYRGVGFTFPFIPADLKVVQWAKLFIDPPF